MTTDGNKVIVRKFIKDVLGGGNIELIDELLAPDYVNPSMGVTNRNGFKAVISGLKALRLPVILKSGIWWPKAIR